MTANKWNQYRMVIKRKIAALHENIKYELAHKKDVYTKNSCIKSASHSMCDFIYHAATNVVGRDKIPDISKPYITTETVDIINNLRQERKGIINRIVNRIKHLKSESNGSITNLQI